MSRKPAIDPENPEWTEADFARAKGAEFLPAHVLVAFPKTAARTVARSRINEALAGMIRR